MFELVDRTVLQALEAAPRGLGNAAAKRILWQLLRALDYLHSRSVRARGSLMACQRLWEAPHPFAACQSTSTQKAELTFWSTFKTDGFCVFISPDRGMPCSGTAPLGMWADMT